MTAIILAACGGGGSNNTSPSTEGNNSTGSTQPTSCPTGQTLQNGACVANPTPTTCTPPKELKNGECVTPTPTCTAPQVLKDGKCITPPTPINCTPPKELKNGECVTPTPTCTKPQVLKNGKCVAPPPSNELTCPEKQVPNADDTACIVPGKTGYSRVRKTDSSNTFYPKTECVQDNATGRIWEVKTNDGGLRDGGKTYTNYLIFEVDGLSFYGNVNMITIDDLNAATNSEGYAKAVNATALCGYTDWRLPLREELSEIVVKTGTNPTIDTSVFPNTQSSEYWTGMFDTRKGPDNVYTTDFGSQSDGKTRSASAKYPVRLVRGGLK